MYSSSDWRKAVTKLLELTSIGNISWGPSDLYQDENNRQVIESFEASYLEKVFVISNVKYQQYIDETEWYWATECKLGVYERTFDKAQKIATAPDLHTLSSLFSAAKDSYAYSKNALGGLLD